MARKYFDEVDWTANLKIASGSIAHTAGDTKTTVKKTAVISLMDTISCEQLNPTNKYLLSVLKPINAIAGNAVAYAYNVQRFGDTTTTRDVVRDTTTVVNVSNTTSYKDKVIEGLFLGSEKKIKIGIAYATTTTSALTAYYSLYRL